MIAPLPHSTPAEDSFSVIGATGDPHTIYQRIFDKPWIRGKEVKIVRGGKNEDIIGAVVPCPVKSPSDHLTSLRGPGQGM